jgi:hypothetical protein
MELILFQFYMTILKKPTYSPSMCVFPDFNPLTLTHFSPLVEFHVTLVAQGCASVVMRFNTSTFAVTKLIGMCSHNCAVSSTTDLAWGLSK